MPRRSLPALALAAALLAWPGVAAAQLDCGLFCVDPSPPRPEAPGQATAVDAVTAAFSASLPRLQAHLARSAEVAGAQQAADEALLHMTALARKHTQEAEARRVAGVAAILERLQQTRENTLSTLKG